MSNIKDITGQVFGLWTVLYKCDHSLNGAVWHCRCICGNEKDIRGSDLRYGTTKSCGCIKRKPNRFDFSNDSYIVGYTNKGDVFYFDCDDYDLIAAHAWYANEDGYLITRIKNKIIRMHRLIMNIQDPNVFIDHINHHPNDNRKCNLRIATVSLNGANSKTIRSEKSPYKGVYATNCNTWQAKITYDKQRIYLGSFKNLEDAIAARKAAEEKYFGEYSYDNSQAYAQQYALPEQQITNIQ